MLFYYVEGILGSRLGWVVLADVVPAASSGGAADPVPLEGVDLPVALRVVRQGVGRHVADFHLVVVPLEVLELHPGVRHRREGHEGKVRLAVGTSQ